MFPPCPSLSRHWFPTVLLTEHVCVLLSWKHLDMATDKQTEGKVSNTDENKENSPDGGLGLESILCYTPCDSGFVCVRESVTPIS